MEKVKVRVLRHGAGLPPVGSEVEVELTRVMRGRIRSRMVQVLDPGEQPADEQPTAEEPRARAADGKPTAGEATAEEPRARAGRRRSRDEQGEAAAAAG